ncbi:unnamed protein product [Amoebophrya sp. A25]|nr:unnamed protein product [Amoebophrya sp. A25]|eukprot:GSA25T00008693001.1
MIEIDGYIGGGQILRNAVAIAAVTCRPVRIVSIRHCRPKPGLQAQHLAAVKLVARIVAKANEAMITGNIKNGSEPEAVVLQLPGDDGDDHDASRLGLKGAFVGSCELEYVPKKARNASGKRRRPQIIDADCGTAGSISLMLQASFIPLRVLLGHGQSNFSGRTTTAGRASAVASRATKVNFTGGTDVAFSPPCGYVTDIFEPIVAKLFGPTLFRMSMSSEQDGDHPSPKRQGLLDIRRRGFHPRGGGRAEIEACCTSSSKDEGTSSEDKDENERLAGDGEFRLPSFTWTRRGCEEEGVDAMNKKLTDYWTVAEVKVSIFGDYPRNEVEESAFYSPGPDSSLPSSLRKALSGVKMNIDEQKVLYTCKTDGAGVANVSSRNAGFIQFGVNILCRTKAGTLFYGAATTEKNKGGGKGSSKGNNSKRMKKNEPSSSGLLDGVFASATANLAENVKEHAFSSVVDEYMQDQLILPMALATGKTTLETGFLTEHTSCAMRVCEALLPCKFECKKEETSSRAITCEGAGFFCRETKLHYKSNSPSPTRSTTDNLHAALCRDLDHIESQIEDSTIEILEMYCYGDESRGGRGDNGAYAYAPYDILLRIRGTKRSTGLDALLREMFEFYGLATSL